MTKKKSDGQEKKGENLMDTKLLHRMEREHILNMWFRDKPVSFTDAWLDKHQEFCPVPTPENMNATVPGLQTWEVGAYLAQPDIEAVVMDYALFSPIPVTILTKEHKYHGEAMLDSHPTSYLGDQATLFKGVSELTKIPTQPLKETPTNCLTAENVFKLFKIPEHLRKLLLEVAEAHRKTQELWEHLEKEINKEITEWKSTTKK